MDAETQSPPQTNELLQRILKAVESAKPKRGFEVACAIVLSLATTASAWCAYQAKLWGGAQLARVNASVRASREGVVSTLAAWQARAFDASMFICYAQAVLGKDAAMERFLAERLRPEMKSALEAWLKLDPFNNAAAPPSPLHMPEYDQKETAEAARQEAAAAEALRAAREARQFSDNYVLLTVLFASVLFFGGIARAFDSRRVRLTLAGLAVVLFMATVAGLLTMPICRE
jgi:hypothetical protein